MDGTMPMPVQKHEARLRDRCRLHLHGKPARAHLDLGTPLAWAFVKFPMVDGIPCPGIRSSPLLGPPITRA